ncbi:hypothetical protein DPMN_032687 [Dreissena polymorpha]|uniref:Uncharacterized protein n=1 Tax=Dreissena polymorpha TaxID=45954 RepID=A0A9D4RJ55_DREPO|nr:hypothetical protein DPMN_032687 [Dreissena polymorpha]
MNLLNKVHEDQTINVASRALTRFYYSHSYIRKNAPPLGSHVFQANVTIFKLIQDIIETNLLTKFHDDWTINVAFRVFTRKNAPPLGSHVFHANKINVASRVLTRKTASPPGGHVFSPIWTIFELVRDSNKINVLTKRHDDWAKIVTSRVFTRNTALSPGAIFKLSRGINGTNTINVASRVFTRQNVDYGQHTTDKRQSQKLTMSTFCSEKCDGRTDGDKTISPLR